MNIEVPKSQRLPSGTIMAFLLALLVVGGLLVVRSLLYPSTDHTGVLGTEYRERCLTPADEHRPVFECYEIVVDADPYSEVIASHESGDTHKTLTFRDQGETRFRFTPSLPGRWTFSTGGEIDIQTDRPEYAKGFVTAAGHDWTRSATGEAFVPQFVMYDGADLDAALQEFVLEHGFTGFHVKHLRDFLENPGYFEAVVLKTYRLGGTTHFWIWGDEMRRQTPSTYGVDAEKLYREIAARLAPLPGWTVGYGFDLYEWASAEEVEDFRATLNDYTSYRHMVGARGETNSYRPISDELDYASWEWHRPTIQDYREHLSHAGGKPAFSEDRFRIRNPSRYPEKDYDPEMTRRGLWRSVIAGGVANIWGNTPDGGPYSDPYSNKSQLRVYRDVVDRYFKRGMTPRTDILATGDCLEASTHYLCYVEDIESVQLTLTDAPPSIVAIDTRSGAVSHPIPADNQDISLDRRSDWALILGKATSAPVVE